MRRNVQPVEQLLLVLAWGDGWVEAPEIGVTEASRNPYSRMSHKSQGKRAGLTLQSYECCDGRTIMSTRRFCTRPARVSLLAMG